MNTTNEFFLEYFWDLTVLIHSEEDLSADQLQIFYFCEEIEAQRFNKLFEGKSYV